MTHGSTFSGIGGPEVAAAMLGWDNLFHCEINPFGRKILDYYFPNAKSYEDITKTDFSEWRGKIDVLTGGFPCQPFSYAGKRRGAEDDRYLWPYMLRAIEQIRPTWFVGENVGGIATMVLPGETDEVAIEPNIFEQGDTYEKTTQQYVLDEICRNLERIGYDVQPFLIPAAAVGAPHRRDRIFIIAFDTITNTNGSYDGRTAGKYEGEGEGERLQERHAVRQSCKPNQVRPESVGAFTNSANAQRDGCEFNKRRGQQTFPKSGNSNCAGVPTNSAAERSLGENCTKGYCKTGWDSVWGNTPGHDSPDVSARWRTFPTVSPVCRGNDGLPFSLDNLTISQSEWRNESLKAYGNAIVPQVMWMIFKAIEETYGRQDA